MHRHLDALLHELVPAPLESADVVAGEPAAQVAELGALGGIDYGLWQLSEGQVRDTEADEVFVVLRGAGTIEFADGESVTLAPGVLVKLSAGERTTWTITQTLRKFWITASCDTPVESIDK